MFINQRSKKKNVGHSFSVAWSVIKVSGVDEVAKHLLKSDIT